MKVVDIHHCFTKADGFEIILNENDNYKRTRDAALNDSSVVAGYGRVWFMQWCCGLEVKTISFHEFFNQEFEIKNVHEK